MVPVDGLELLLQVIVTTLVQGSTGYEVTEGLSDSLGA